MHSRVPGVSGETSAMPNPPGQSPPSALLRDPNLRIVFAVTLMAVLGVVSITPAFPTVIEAWRIPPHSVGLLITAFTLPGVILTPILGVVADRFGRKRVLVPSLMLFGLAGVACGFAPSYAALIALRLVQGIGAAALGSLNVTIIGDLYSGRERGAAMGYNASVLSIGTGSFPAVGGALAMLGWRYPFFLSLTGVVVGLIVLFRLRNPEPRNAQTLGDYLRAIARSFDRRVAGLFLASTATFIVLYGAYLTYFPLLVRERFGGSSIVIGGLMSAMSLVTAATSSQLGRLTSRFPERRLIAASFGLYGLALLLIPAMPQIWLLLVPTVVFGLAHGVNIPAIQTVLARLAPMEHRGAFMSANGMVLRLGQTLGPLVAGACASQWGVDGAFVSAAMLAAIMAVAAWVTVR
jgi:MFS transporter, ACDE family, multidrug resistance protein